MAYTLAREKARKLRRRGKSIRLIAEVLSANKSTVSYWCRDIALTPSQIAKLSYAQRKASLIALAKSSEQKRLKRMQSVAVESARGASDVGRLAARDRFMLGLALYWGEGYKSGNEELGFTNSDPGIIRAFMRWVEKAYGVQRSQMILRISINEAHARRVPHVLDFWSKQTGVSISQFTRTSLIKTAAKKTYSDANNHFGTLRVKIRRATALRRRILGSIAEVSRQMSPTRGT